jgi:hypothetical protein
MMMAGDIEAVVRAVIDAAKGSDMTATRLVLHRFGAADVVQTLAVVADARAMRIRPSLQIPLSPSCTAVGSCRGATRSRTIRKPRFRSAAAFLYAYHSP